MLLFGLFRRKRLFDHLSCPRSNAESSTLDRGLCGYAVPTCHDIFSPPRLAPWHLLKRYHHLDEVLVGAFLFFWNLRHRLELLWTRVQKSLALGAGFAHEARVLRPLTWMNSNSG